MSPTQIRAARAMLDWSMLDLARAAGVSISTVKRVESEGHQPLSQEIQTAVGDALEKAGVRFLDDDGKGAGVRLRPP